MKKIIIFIGTIFLLLNPILNAEKVVLKDVSVQNDVLRVKTTAAAKFNVFKISHPDRLVIDLFDTGTGEANKEIPVTSQLIKKVRISQYQEKPTRTTRIVLELDKRVKYETKQNNGEIAVSLVSEAPKEVQVSTTEQLVAEIFSEESKQEQKGITEKEKPKKEAKEEKKPVEISKTETKEGIKPAVVPITPKPQV